MTFNRLPLTSPTSIAAQPTTSQIAEVAFPMTFSRAACNRASDDPAMPSPRLSVMSTRAALMSPTWSALPVLPVINESISLTPAP
jgi:hypothetical protein